jgi:hypothetical protein
LETQPLPTTREEIDVAFQAAKTVFEFVMDVDRDYILTSLKRKGR